MTNEPLRGEKSIASYLADKYGLSGREVRTLKIYLPIYRLPNHRLLAYPRELDAAMRAIMVSSTEENPNSL